MSNASRIGGRKEKKARAPRAARRIDADNVKYQALPSAIVDGKFIAVPEQTVFVLRYRNRKNSWHRCTVRKFEGTFVQLWDEILGQWFCFDVPAENLPDVRLSGG